MTMMTKTRVNASDKLKLIADLRYFEKPPEAKAGAAHARYIGKAYRLPYVIRPPRCMLPRTLFGD